MRRMAAAAVLLAAACGRVGRSPISDGPQGTSEAGGIGDSKDTGETESTKGGALPAPARPSPCEAIAAGASVQRLIDAAPDGGALCLADGVYLGPLLLGRGVTLWGTRAAVIKSNGQGTTVQLTGRGARLLGVTVDGSGGRYDQLDGAVRVEAEDAVVEGVRIEHAVFGLLVEKSRAVTLRGNSVMGTDEGPLGLRGDGLRLWETRDSLVEKNSVEHSRDLVVWYSSHNRLIGNDVRHGRYGTHLMYSHDNLVEGNRYLGNVVGVFLMYSRNVVLRKNLIADGTGASGIGLGIKESGNLTIEDNRFVRNTIGVYVDTSPLQETDHDRFAGNLFALSDAGLVFHGRAAGNTITGNCFRDNQVPVRVEGGDDAQDAKWLGNDFDDYAGYDLDGDGYGDVPYELRSLSGQLTARHPSLDFFRGSPALGLVDAAASILPLFKSHTVLRDARPRVGSLRLETLRAN